MIKPLLSSYLIFTSRAVALMSAADLSNLLSKAYRVNQMHSITGMLLYMEIRFMNKLEGRFMQLIEGDELQIQSLYEKLRLDHRHDNILLLASGQQSSSNFSNWSMSYTGQAPQHLGYKVLEDKLFESNQFLKGHGPAHFLKTFYDYNLQLQKEYSLQAAEFCSDK